MKWLIVEDEFTREGLALEVKRGMKASDVLEVLKTLILIRGAPRHIRSDNLPGRAGVYRHGDPRVPGSCGDRDAVYRAGLSLAERLC